jgi:glycerol-3-phosphate dehydrogenase (NAD(P)+)
MSKILLIGSGSWGLAIASVLAFNNHEVMLYTRDSLVAEEINKKHTNSKNLKGIILSPLIKAFTDFKDKGLLSNIDTAFLAIPTLAFAAFFNEHFQDLQSIKNFVICSKGFTQIEERFVSSAEFLSQKFIGTNQIVLSGPNFASELVERKKTITTLSSINPKSLEYVSGLLCTNFLEIETSNDPEAILILGLCKNPIAIGCGLAYGLTGSANAKARFLTKISQETVKILEALNLNTQSFLNSAGIGDIFLSGGDERSRNFSYGVNLAKGVTYASKTTEGIYSLKAINFIMQSKKLTLKHYQTLYECVHMGLDVTNILS